MNDQLPLVYEKQPPPPPHQPLQKEDLPKANHPAPVLSSSLDPTRPWPRGAQRFLLAPHRTLQLPKPKRGALLSAGIWVVVERLHCLVHELQCWLGSFHGGGGGDGDDSEDSDTSPGASRLLRLQASLLSWPQPLPGWRHLLLSGRYQGRGVPRGSCPLGNSG